MTASRRPSGPKSVDHAPSQLAPHATREAEVLTDLQRTAGNRAVSRFLESDEASLQRVPVSTEFHETLYNKTATTGLATAPPKGFTGKPTDVANPDKTSYEMTRSGSGVTVLIKIRYLQQTRNTVAPPSPNPSNLPEIGALLGRPTVIPANDPTDRRTWASDAANKATAHWTGLKISFASTDHPQPGEGAGSYAAPLPPTPVRLPVTFKAEAVFGLNDPAHHQVIVHPPSTVAGSLGNPIDKGNWYQQDPAARSAKYPHSDDVIYAHEYGHMLGIPDEYSQSNEQLNALLHQAAPASAASSRAALDKTTIERMTLAGLTARLSGQLLAAMPIMVAALNGKRRGVVNRLAAAARSAAVSADVRSVLVGELTAESDARTSPKVPTAVAFETTRNFSNLDIASQAVAGGFAIGPVTKLIMDAYNALLAAPHKANVAVADFDAVRINISSAVSGSAGAATPLAVPAATEVTSLVGPAAPGPGLPVVPPGTLIAQLSALPATWSAAGSTLESSVSAATFSAAMATGLRNVAAGAALVRGAAALLPGLAAPTPLGSTNALYRRAYALVQKAATDAATQVVGELLSATVKPTLDASVTSLQSSINAEVTRITTTPPVGVAAAGPADPQMATIVAAMKARLDADKTATAGTGRDPTKAGGAAPDQNVTYSAQGLMGSSNSSAVRVDQFQAMLDAFNAKLRQVPREDVFTVDVGK
ncbi:hypothetical protein ACPPVT_05740 [Angustibacter sp. McL0619]|uniref:hypothetical protein n=1 Tax=Angustibacter sp. McL0619 TaxID=3415676 RepID=UPI003CF8F02B